MAYFARAVRYAGTDCESAVQGFCAIIELTRHKGSKTIKCFVYRYSTGLDRELHEIVETKNIEEAQKIFPYAAGCQWQKTTAWLSRAVVARSFYFVSGEYREHCSWVRVCLPSPWKKRHKKRPLQVGNPAHILVSLEYQLRLILEEKCSLERERNGLESYSHETDEGFVCESDEGFVPDQNLTEYTRITQEITAVEEEIDGIYRDIRNIKDELRFKKARALGKQYLPRTRDRSHITPSTAVV